METEMTKNIFPAAENQIQVFQLVELPFPYKYETFPAD
jgi:hypothetical protein